MDAFGQLNSTYEIIIALLGTLGLIIALVYMLRRKRPQPELKVETATPLPAPKATTWWEALSKTRDRFLFRESADIKALKENFEEACIISDLGVGNTHEALAALDWKMLGEQPESLRGPLARQQLAKIVEGWLKPSTVAENGSGHWPVARPGEPCVIWFVGVNGVGKTTSIAKLAKELLNKGHTVLLGAGDTFRAAAGEQLEAWAQRLGIDCVRGQSGADSSAVLFDAVQAAKARKVDFVLCDSAGRLHNQTQLMEALSKNRRVMEKALPGAPHETLLVLDANTGQNMLNQATQFLAAVGVTGLVLTKLDGTARGGAVVAVARKTALPLRRLGLGETPEDFISFDPKAFTEALLGISPSVGAGLPRTIATA